jgi:hypothetical protein
VRYENASRQFRFTGTRAECQLEAQVEGICLPGCDFCFDINLN